jgi:hypothetical protein
MAAVEKVPHLHPLWLVRQWTADLTRTGLCAEGLYERQLKDRNILHLHGGDTQVHPPQTAEGLLGKGWEQSQMEATGSGVLPQYVE